MVWIFVTPSTIEIVGTGDVVPALPLNITPTNDFLKDIPKDLPITIPHSYPRNRGNCKVYVIWSVSPSGKIDVAKYGMTCIGDYEDQCNMRPESQCKKFIAEDTKGYKYYYNWVTRDISKEMCHIIEKSLTASYVITNGGRLPTHYYLPCFNKKDDFEREGRAKKWIEEMIKQYGK